MDDEIILFTPIPECANLCLFICKLNEVIFINGSPMSFFCTQIYNCRFIIEEFPGVIAAPMPGTINYIEIITENDYVQTKKLQSFLKSENFRCFDQKAVTLEKYKECLLYTIKCRLSPLWNRMGQYLCQGNDFLITSEEIDAIQFDLSITENRLYLKFNSYKLQIYPLTIEDLQLNPSLVGEFLHSPKGVIELGQSWFNVLPSTFKARLLSVSKQIPSICPFNNYQELRVHWKNMYGYILPESSEGMLYYEVHFKAFPDQVFMYPDVCLHSQPPKIVNHENDAFTCTKFEDDLRDRVRSICGKTLSFVKSNSNEIEHFNATPSPRFIPAKKIKAENSISTTPMSSIFKKLKPNESQVPLSSIFNNLIAKDSQIVDQKPILKLKQETLNFPKKVVFAENVSLKNSPGTSDSIGDSSQSKSSASKIVNFHLSSKDKLLYTQSQPLNRKLIVDAKLEEDISQKSDTFNSILNQTNYKDSIKRKNPKELQLFHALLEEKSDDFFRSIIDPPPTKRVKIFPQKPASPRIEESVSKYFKEQKPTPYKSVQTQGNKLQFHNLIKK